ncbi:hypothetical protein SNE40_013745 [Patella caerulea]|uniref:Uncharacterized protein n=1 Tax=Patella caerulea TaxID=87958 RepID=A0AAN8JFM7_PATCE
MCRISNSSRHLSKQKRTETGIITSFFDKITVENAKKWPPGKNRFREKKNNLDNKDVSKKMMECEEILELLEGFWLKEAVEWWNVMAYLSNLRNLIIMFTEPQLPSQPIKPLVTFN